MRLKFKTLSQYATIPKYATKGAAGMDLHSSADIVIPPNSTVLVPTDLSVEIPLGFELQVRPRSGLTLKSSLHVHLGTVDSDYRGHLGIIAENRSSTESFTVNRYDRIAQAVVMKLSEVIIEEVTEISDTERGTGGFGSTGV